MVALVSIRYELRSQPSVQALIEDPRNGIAFQNGWWIEPHEISYLNHNPCKKYKNSTIVRVIVSRRVCNLIKEQRGLIWVSGGTATVYWNGKPVDSTNNVKFNYQ